MVKWPLQGGISLKKLRSGLDNKMDVQEKYISNTHLQTSDPLSAGVLSDIYWHKALASCDTQGPHLQGEMSGLQISTTKLNT